MSKHKIEEKLDKIREWRKNNIHYLQHHFSVQELSDLDWLIDSVQGLCEELKFYQHLSSRLENNENTNWGEKE